MSPDELARAILRKVGPQTERDQMLEHLRDYLKDDTIEEDGLDLHFRCEKESDYEGRFPIRLLLEMYRIDMLDDMFLMPAIVPHLGERTARMGSWRKRAGPRREARDMGTEAPLNVAGRRATLWRRFYFSSISSARPYSL